MRTHWLALFTLLLCASVARAGLVGYWTFDDGTGTTLADVTGRGNDGTIVNAPAWVAGHTGEAADLSLAFTGTEYVNLGNPADLQITGDQTISMWLYPTDLTARRNPYAKAYGGEGTITQEPSGGVSYYYGESGGTTEWTGFSGPPVIPNQWNHLVVVRDLANGKVRIHVNDSVRVTNTTRGCGAGTRPAYFGRGYVSNYIGQIDDVGIWSEALSPTDVLLLTQGAYTPDTLGVGLVPITQYTYSAYPNAHTDYYNDEGKDPDENGTWDNPVGDLTDGLFVGSIAPDDSSVGWQSGTRVDIDFTFDRERIIDRVLIDYNVYLSFGNDAPDDMQLSFSTDGVSYSTPVTYTGFTGTGLQNMLALDIPNQYARYARLRFDGGTANGGSKYLIDEVTFTAVPEPATLALFGIGAALSALRRRRQRR